MKKMLDLLSAEVAKAFAEAGYDEKYARVSLSNRPDLCEYQCNGAMAVAKEYHKAPIMIANAVVEADYVALETALQNKVDSIETDHPGYDEYNYSLSEISHNPFELAALLTVLYENYTQSEVQSKLQTIFDYQYTLTSTEVVEIRTRTERA